MEPTVDCAMLSHSPRPPETTTSLDIRHAKGFVHKVQIHTDVKPVQQKLRRLPLSVCDTVTAELNELEKQGTIEGVDSSEWFSPIVVTRRKNGKIIKTRQWSPTATRVNERSVAEEYDIQVECGSHMGDESDKGEVTMFTRFSFVCVSQ